MVKFFEQNVSTSAAAASRAQFISTEDKIKYLKLAIGIFVFFNLIKSVAAQTCFDVDDHDYTLTCTRGEADIYAQYAKCGAVQDGADDCARFFVSTINFCSGLIAGTICTLDFHTGTVPNDCIVNATRDFCRSGFGSIEDYFVTTIGSMGVVVLAACCIAIACVPNRSRSIRDVEGLGEEMVPLTSETDDHIDESEGVAPVQLATSSMPVTIAEESSHRLHR